MMDNTSNETAMETKPLRLERETCSRCGGSGSYSYCTSHGTTCFKCGGKKEVLTKRGRAAYDYLVKLRSVAAADLEPGMVILDNGITHGGVLYSCWSTVVEISKDTTDFKSFVNGVEQPQRKDLLQIETTHKRFGNCVRHLVAPEQLFELYGTKEFRQETLKKAIEYQNTLTKQGKEPKRLAKK